MADREKGVLLSSGNIGFVLSVLALCGAIYSAVGGVVTTTEKASANETAISQLEAEDLPARVKSLERNTAVFSSKMDNLVAAMNNLALSLKEVQVIQRERNQ